MFYETKHSLQGDLIKIEDGADFSFPSHLHSSFELIFVSEGEMTVTVDKNQHLLTPGNAVLIFPNQLHSLETKVSSRHKLCIFSAKLVQGFSSTYLTKLPVSNLFTPTPFYLEQLFQAQHREEPLKAKGILYCLCAEFDGSAGYRGRIGEKGDLLQRIFSFVENNYHSRCSLADLAAYTTYHPVYLSRFFKQYTGLSFTDHVNRYRINEAAYMLKNSGRKILDIALDCGFESLRSFNRNFKLIMGTTPKEYRQK